MSAERENNWMSLYLQHRWSAWVSVQSSIAMDLIRSQRGALKRYSCLVKRVKVVFHENQIHNLVRMHVPHTAKAAEPEMMEKRVNKWVREG